jgi:hypothetical protein
VQPVQPVKTVGTVGTVGTIGMISKIKTGGVASIFHENITVTYSFSLTHLNPCIDNLTIHRERQSGWYFS